MSDAETRISVIIGLVFSFFLLAAVFEEFSTRKLSVVFFILFWIPMLVVHEMGHALAAKALGWRVHEVVIGFGRTLWKAQYGETRIKIKLAPVEGYVLPAPAEASAVRLKSALVYAAGPGAELLVLFVLLAAFGWDTVFNQSDQVGLIALKTLAFVILVGAGFNLLPFRTDGAVSDGLGILSSPFMTSEVIDLRLIAIELREAQALLDAGRPGEASFLVDKLLERFPDSLPLQLMSGIAICQDGRIEEARSLTTRRLAEATDSESVRRAWLKVQALVELSATDPHFMTLDIAVQRALKMTPDASDLLAIKGASLVLRGNYDAGGEMLAHAWRKGGDRSDDPLMLGFLAVAARKTGNAEASSHFYDAFELTNRSVALRRRIRTLMT